MKQLFITSLLLIAAAAQHVQAATSFTVDGYKYTILDAKERTVEFGTDARYGNKTNVVVPETVEYNGVTYTVTSIGIRAFYNKSQYSASLSPNSLETISLPKTIKSIGENAFCWCDKLRDFQFPEQLESIGNGAFSRCVNAFTNSVIVIPNSVKTIGDYAFTVSEGQHLSKIIISESVESMGMRIASPDTLVYNVINGKYAGTISGGYIFYNDSLKCLIFGDKVREIPSRFLGWASNNAISKIVLPDNVETINSNAFNLRGWTALKEIEFGKGCKKVDRDAFTADVTIPDIEVLRFRSKIPPLAYEKDYMGNYTTKASFEGPNLENCRMEVPAGTEATYGIAQFWRTLIGNLIEDEELGDYGSGDSAASDGFSFAQNSSIIETQSSAVMPVSIHNKRAIVAIEFDMEIPDDVKLGNPIVELTERTEGAEVVVDEVGNGVVHVTIRANGAIAAGKGAILNVVLSAAKAGTYELKLKNVKVTTGQEISLDDSELQFVANHKKGDYNEDGSVNITDVQDLLDYVMGS